MDFSSASHRRLGVKGLMDGLRESVERRLGTVTGSISYQLQADGKSFFNKTVALVGDKEIEHFETVEVPDGDQHAKDYTMYVTAQKSDGKPVAFMAQVIR